MYYYYVKRNYIKLTLNPEGFLKDTKFNMQITFQHPKS